MKYSLVEVVVDLCYGVGRYRLSGQKKTIQTYITVLYEQNYITYTHFILVTNILQVKI